MTVRPVGIMLALALASTPMLGIAAPADSSSPIIMWRSELEDSPSAADCGSHGLVQSRPGASGGLVLNVSRLCVADVPAFTANDSWRPKRLRVAAEPVPDDLPEGTRIGFQVHYIHPEYGLEVTLARGSIPLPEGDSSFHDIEWASSGSRPAGSYSDVRILTYGFVPRTSGPLWDWVDLGATRVHLDHAEFGCGNVDTDERPTQESGFGPNRDLYWTGIEYALRASFEDPEGDPLEFSWFGPSIQGSGATVPHTFESESTTRAYVVAYDDPLARCADAEVAVSRTAVVDLASHDPDWASRIVSPAPTESCVADLKLPAVAGHRVFAGGCVIRADVDTLDMPRDLVGGATFRLDGEPFAEAAAPHFQAVLDASAHLPGEHVLDVCFFAVNDEKRGLNCSPGERILIV